MDLVKDVIHLIRTAVNCVTAVSKHFNVQVGNAVFLVETFLPSLEGN